MPSLILSRKDIAEVHSRLAKIKGRDTINQKYWCLKTSGKLFLMPYSSLNLYSLNSHKIRKNLINFLMNVLGLKKIVLKYEFTVPRAAKDKDMLLSYTSLGKKIIFFNENSIVKYSLDKKSLSGLENEINFYRNYSKSFPISVPKFIESGSNYIAISRVKGSQSIKKSDVIKTFKDRTELSINKGSTKKMMNEYLGTIDKKYLNKILSIAGGQSLFNQDNLIHLGTVHGDFSSWNMIKSNKIILFDWEDWHDNGPICFDYFHYFFNDLYLLKRQKFNFVNFVNYYLDSLEKGKDEHNKESQCAMLYLLFRFNFERKRGQKQKNEFLQILGVH
tara:strand:+ start:18767 stop:19762 length:996 start_codon:yes stop_codon:yes gene_type:complete